jgi:uncharacterized protein YciI
LSQSGSFPGHGGEDYGEGEWIGMAEWIHFIHAPRDNFAATMTDEETRVWRVHFERFQRLLAGGVIVLVGPTIGSVNTGIAIFEAPDETSARRIMDEDPVIAGGYARGELRPFRISLLRGR